MVYGTTGSGKSTLAARIGEATGLPYHAIDDLTWLPGWQVVPSDRQREIIAELVAGDEWVIDSGYAKWLDLVLPRVDLIVGLDYAPALIFSRLVRRTFTRIVTGERVCNGNREQLRMQLSRNSILLWFFKSYRRKRARMREFFTELPCDLVCFTRPRDATTWLRSLKRDG
jgi:adenylate kinase family enzyme